MKLISYRSKIERATKSPFLLFRSMINVHRTRNNSYHLRNHTVIPHFFCRQSLTEKNSMHEYETKLRCALIKPVHENLQDLVDCPFYASCDRSSKQRASSFLSYIKMASKIPQDLLFKKGIMLAIDDTEE